MLIDTQTRFSGTHTAAGVISGQSITDDAISEHVLDLRNFRSGVTKPATADEGILSMDQWLVLFAKTAAAGGDAAKTLIVTLESAADAALSSGAVVHYTSATFTGAQITAGARLLAVQLPSADYKRYLGLRYNVSAAFTAFELLAFLTPTIDRNIIYPAGYDL